MRRNSDSDLYSDSIDGSSVMVKMREEDIVYILELETGNGRREGS